MTNKDEVEDIWRKLSNDALAVAIAVGNNDPLAVAMSLIEFRFSQTRAAKLMWEYSKQRMEENPNA